MITMYQQKDKDGGCLGKSIKNFQWELLQQDCNLVAKLSQELGIDEILARIILNRGIKDTEEARLFFEPKLRHLMPNPFLLKDMDKAVERIIKAIRNKEKILIYADYDVDGATSAAVMLRFLKFFDIDASVYIPCRLKEGYGPNKRAFKSIKDQKIDLTITVDCGTVSFEPLKYAKELGLDVIVIDHHLSTTKLPDAIAVVNPNRFDEEFSVKEIAAVGVTFLVITAIRNALKKQNWFSENNKKEPDLIQLLDLVALGTVCDVMPLNGINRVFVSHGLKLMAKRKNAGIAALSNLTKIDTKPKSYHLGYVIGPRINAGGRVGQGGLGATLLSTESEEKAHDIAFQLEKLNQERKALEAFAFEEAIEQIERKNMQENSIIIATGEDWHIGILGILASKVKEKYNRPAAVISIHNGLGKGSARSIPGLDLGGAITSAKEMGFLIDGGGHAMAGGFTVEKNKINEFYTFLLDRLDNYHDLDACFKKAKELKIDALLSVNAVAKTLLNNINKAAPFGNGNLQPRFALCDVKVIRAQIVGQIHVMIIVKDNSGEYFNNTLKCILYRGAENKIGQFLLKNIGRMLNIAGFLQQNELDDRKIDFVIEDVALNE